MNWLARLKNHESPGTHPTKPTKPGFVGFVGTPDAHIQKIEGDEPEANDPATGPDRWCWPHSTAMNTAEIDTFKARLAKFSECGLDLEEAEQLADRLVLRDRGIDDRHVCMECSRCVLQGAASWRCGNWKDADISILSKDANLPKHLLTSLQRCDGFSERPDSTSQATET